MLCPTDSAKGILKRQHVMSQAWSQFASKNLGVPKGEIKKKKKKTHTQKTKKLCTKLLYFAGCFASSNKPFMMDHVQHCALKSVLQPRGCRAARYHTTQAFPGQEGLSWPSISFINTHCRAAQQFPKQAESKSLHPQAHNPAQTGCTQTISLVGFTSVCNSIVVLVRESRRQGMLEKRGSSLWLQPLPSCLPCIWFAMLLGKNDFPCDNPVVPQEKNGLPETCHNSMQ